MSSGRLIPADASNLDREPLNSPISIRNAVPLELTQEGGRIMRLCNACRYCEGYCAVFPAMERRLAFTEQDLNYLANLCHNCGECYYACPYTPPHEFNLNLPRTLAETRLATYRKYAWPGVLGVLFRRNGIATAAAMVGGPVLFLVAMLAGIRPARLFSAHPDSTGSFYAVLSHHTMVLTFGLVSLYVVAALLMGFMRCWQDTGETIQALLNPAAWSEAIGNTMQLRYLEGGGEGCAYPGETPSHARRWFHHLTFYGFLLCFASTTVAAIYHYIFRWYAPYPFLSAPVVLGTVGGIGLVIGPIGLLLLKFRNNKELSDPNQTGMDVSFIVLLFLTSATGLLLMIFRETAAMGLLLAVHLGAVFGLFATMPYGKFVHGIYRFAALVRNSIEKRRPPLILGAE